MPSLLSMILAIAVPMAAPPPPMISSVLVPPPVFNPVPVSAEGDRLPPVPVKVAVSLGREVLWSGTLSVGSSPARLSLNEAVEIKGDCTQPSYRANARTIEVTLSRQAYRIKDGFALTARFSRPAQDGLCPVGTRQVSLDQMLSLPDGSVTVEGDGGFRVVLTR